MRIRLSRGIGLVLSVGSLLVGSASAQPTTRKHALLVGLNEYRYTIEGIPTLQFAKADVEALEAVLKGQGYEVKVLPNDRARRQDIIDELYSYAYRPTEIDAFLLFYAGHGLRNSLNGKTYWLTYDTQLGALESSAIRLQHLMEYMADIRAKRKLVLLDHCFSGDVVLDVSLLSPAPPPGPAPPGGGRSGLGALRVRNAAIKLEELEPQISAEGIVVIGASRSEALESASLGHGVFTQALLQAMDKRDADTNKDARLSIGELIEYLRKEVPRLAQTLNGSQQVVPRMGGVDPTGWTVAENLPVDDLTEVSAKVAKYQETLTTWERRGLISRDVKARCWSALDNWKQSVQAGGSLSEDDVYIRNEIRNNLESKTEPEDMRAGMLKVSVEQVLRTH